jgi:nanoRNase/pAp phosphatase (c-di-AMP/oligoRNAs hydrolase)
MVEDFIARCGEWGIAVAGPAKLDGQEVVAVNIPKILMSDTLNRVAAHHKADVVVGWYFSGEDGMFHYSLRSTEIDVSTLASEFGGGGHPRASGFESRKQVLEFQSST